MKSTHRVVPLLLSIGFSVGACRALQAPEGPQPAAPPEGGATVSCRPERAQALPADNRRTRRCVIDVGSRNVKLVVASLEEESPRSILSDRVCRSRMQLGEKTFDQKARAARALGAEDREALAKLLVEYAELCKKDGGELAGAIATEWARRATNMPEVTKGLEAAGVKLEVLSRDDEARYGYLAATRGAPGKIVLDFGSRSMQLSYWARGTEAPTTASIPLGIDEAGERFFGKREHRRYASAREEFVRVARTQLAPQLAGIRRALRASTLAPELFSLAENGDVPLALDGKLWNGHKGVDEQTYAGLVKARTPLPTPEYGPVTVVLAPRELSALARRLESDQALFEELRSDRVKRIYGYKMLALPALVAALEEDLRLNELVLVPQEMPEGVIVAQLREAAK